MNAYYTEKQKFTEWWIWVLLIISALPMPFIFMYGIYKQLILGEPWGDNPMSDTSLILTAILTTAVIAAIFGLFLTAQLITEVRDRAIYVKFSPFFNSFKRFGEEDIEDWEIIRYNPITRYGGYGIRYSIRNGKAYNIGGKIGLQLYLKNGKKLLIGTQNGDGLRRALQRELGHHNDEEY